MPRSLPAHDSSDCHVSGKPMAHHWRSVRMASLALCARAACRSCRRRAVAAAVPAPAAGPSAAAAACSVASARAVGEAAMPARTSASSPPNVDATALVACVTSASLRSRSACLASSSSRAAALAASSRELRRAGSPSSDRTRANPAPAPPEPPLKPRLCCAGAPTLVMRCVEAARRCTVARLTQTPPLPLAAAPPPRPPRRPAAPSARELASDVPSVTSEIAVRRSSPSGSAALAAPPSPTDNVAEKGASADGAGRSGPPPTSERSRSSSMMPSSHTPSAGAAVAVDALRVRAVPAASVDGARGERWGVRRAASPAARTAHGSRSGSESQSAARLATMLSVCVCRFTGRNRSRRSFLAVDGRNVTGAAATAGERAALPSPSAAAESSGCDALRRTRVTRSAHVAESASSNSLTYACSCSTRVVSHATPSCTSSSRSRWPTSRP